MNLFDPIPQAKDSAQRREAPLAERMRPRTLDEFSGQEHLIGHGKPLRVQIERDEAALDDLLGATRRRQNYAG